ncbi:MAG: aminotransferase class III-fold pyridoxal phosphate-dependent enzyme [Holophaga sp.]|jgi:acetylornithine/succinyldiaminopimelate/putrescine aminotransferase
MPTDLQSTSIPALLPTYTPYPFPILRGEGDRVFDDQGNAYFDFYGGHCVCSTGHAHPKVAEAIARQARELIFYSTAADLPVRARAAEGLLQFANSGQPSGLKSVFFCNSGAEANENALKVAAKLTRRTRFAAFRGGWHGRTILALSVTEDPKITVGLESFLAPCDRLPLNDLAALDGYDFGGVAGVILEPIQSMSGIRPATPEFLARLRERTRAAGCLLIYDEVQTGVGRLGHPYVAGLHGVQPDLVTSAKGIASGVPMGALLMSGPVAGALKPGDLGSTFGGGPLACAALLATLQVILEEGLMPKALALEDLIRQGLKGTCVSEVLGRGLLLGLKVPGGAAKLKSHLQQQRILVGGSGNPEVLRLMPPLNLSLVAVSALLDAVRGFQRGN